MRKNIHVHSNLSVQAFQEAFHLMFPYLKIQLYLKSNGSKEKKQNKILETKIFGELSNQVLGHSFFIEPEHTVIEIIEKFNTFYNLDVKLFRNSGKFWLETTNATDAWTLQEQNNQGKALNA